MDRAKESRAESSEGITGWKVTEHKDWLDVKKEASPKDSADKLEEDNSQVNGSKEEDLRAALKKLEGNHAGIETSLVTDGSNIMEVINLVTDLRALLLSCLYRFIFLRPFTCASKLNPSMLVKTRQLMLQPSLESQTLSTLPFSARLPTDQILLTWNTFLYLLSHYTLRAILTNDRKCSHRMPIFNIACVSSAAGCSIGTRNLP